MVHTDGTYWGILSKSQSYLRNNFTYALLSGAGRIQKAVMS